MSTQQAGEKAIVTTPSDREIHDERRRDGREAGWQVARFVIRNSDGSETGFRGVYREVAPPERLVQTFEWEGMPGHVSVDTATFEDLGERTKVVSDSIFHTTEERDGMIESGMEGGLNDTYDRLEEVLARKGIGAGL